MLGVRDTIVVDTPDALLVCDRKQAQEIKSIVDELRQRGADHLL
jgi:mannose-1-phosphate guanylyltransferase